MTKNNTGGPAFPSPDIGEFGMSLRDYAVIHYTAAIAEMGGLMLIWMLAGPVETHVKCGAMKND